MAIEPMYSLAVAAELIPCSDAYLDVILHRRGEEFPRRYHTEGKSSIRMLTESECLRIRDIVIQAGSGPRGR